MSLKRRLAAAGMSTAGVIAFAAALGVAGQPVNADPLRTPTLAATGDERGRAGYGTVRPTAGGYTGPGATASPTASPTATPGGNVGPTRGSGGYGTASPTASATPGGGGASPDEVPETPRPGGTPGGVSPNEVNGEEGQLPVTGPSLAVVVVGGALLAAGLALVRYSRRRRSA